VEFHVASTNSDYVTNGLEISRLRILYNAFLNWRRAPLSLHNVTDVNVIGNYFGPPITNDDLVPLTNDVIADLWASDYPNLLFTNNVNASTIKDQNTINEDGTNATVTKAFQAVAAPRLTTFLAGSNVTVSWVSPSPGFVLQQIGRLNAGAWAGVTNNPVLAGDSNVVTVLRTTGLTNMFYRAVQR
jgi:hypothetical protein